MPEETKDINRIAVCPQCFWKVLTTKFVGNEDCIMEPVDRNTFFEVALAMKGRCPHHRKAIEKEMDYCQDRWPRGERL